MQLFLGLIYYTFTTNGAYFSPLYWKEITEQRAHYLHKDVLKQMSSKTITKNVLEPKQKKNLIQTSEKKKNDLDYVSSKPLLWG